MQIDGGLGNRARSGRLGYAGTAHAPAPGTYPGIDPLRCAYLTAADAGATIGVAGAPANLAPLLAAALYEIGFSWDAGPLSTWSN